MLRQTYKVLHGCSTERHNNKKCCKFSLLLALKLAMMLFNTRCVLHRQYKSNSVNCKYSHHYLAAAEVPEPSE